MQINASTRMLTLVIFIIYSVLLLGVGFYYRQKSKKETSGDFSKNFFSGGRAMGPLVVGMMLGASVCSSGTFIGGPATGTKEGLVWTVCIYASVFMNFVILGIAGKKIGIIARRTNAVSYVSLLKNRYNDNKGVTILGALAIIGFLIPYCSSQLVGGARLIETMIGIPYLWGLGIFALIILIYTIFGGIKGVSVSTVIQGFIMTFATLLLIFGVVSYIRNDSGSMAAAWQKLAASDHKMIMSPKQWSIPVMFSYIWLVGITYVGLPHAVQGALTYKDTKSLHGAILVGVVFVTFWQGIMTFMGPAARLMNIVPEVADQTTPVIAMTVLPPWLAGVIIAGAVGAIQSTIAAMLIVISSSAVNDIYSNYVRPEAGPDQMKKMTQITTTLVLLAIFLFSIKPPAFLQMLINFAVGGMETIFFGPMLLGLFWKRANEQGALSGMIVGAVCYYLFSYPLKAMISGMQPVLPASLIALAVMAAVSLATPKPPKGVIMTWFGRKYPKEGRAN